MADQILHLIVPIQETNSYLKVDLRTNIFEVHTPKSNPIFKFFAYYIYFSPSKILFCGNHSAQQQPYDEVILIDIEQDIAFHQTPLPVKIGCVVPCMFNKRIYIFGGIGSNGACYYTDLNFTEWKQIGSLPSPAHSISSYAKTDRIILTGYEHIYVYSYDPLNDIFSIYFRYNKPGKS